MIRECSCRLKNRFHPPPGIVDTNSFGNDAVHVLEFETPGTDKKCLAVGKTSVVGDAAVARRQSVQTERLLPEVFFYYFQGPCRLFHLQAFLLISLLERMKTLGEERDLRRW